MQLGRFGGVTFKVNTWFLVLLLIHAGSGLLKQTGIFFGVLLTHELAHLIAAAACDYHVDEIEILPFGGTLRISEQPGTNLGVETLIALAGPLNNFFLAGLGALLYRIGLWEQGLLDLFLMANLSMGLFNLIPVLPLDGGRVYRAWLTRRVGYRRATARVARGGKAVALLLVLAGVGLLFFGVYQLTPFLLAFFLYLAAEKEKLSAGFIPIKGLMEKQGILKNDGAMGTYHLTVLETVTLGEVLKHLVPGKYHLLIVVGEDLEIRGVVTEKRFFEGLTRLGPDARTRKLLEDGSWP